MQTINNILSIVVWSTDPGFCTGCYYNVEVRSKALTQYSIFAKADNTKVITVQQRNPIHDIVSQHFYNFYSFYIPNDNEQTIKI